jgi:hypothetical protein
MPLVKRVAYSLFLLPPKPGAGKRALPRVSNWKMNVQEAAAIGAICIVPGSTEMRDVPETPEEIARATLHYQSAGRDGAQPPK